MLEEFSGVEVCLLFGLAPVLPAALGGKRTFRSGETGEDHFTSFLFATTSIFFCPAAAPYPISDVLKIRKGRAVPN